MTVLRMTSELQSLRCSLNSAIDAIQEEIIRHGLPELSSLSLEAHPIDTFDFDCPPRLFEARKLALASIGQLRNLLQRPYERVIEQSTAVYETASLDFVVKTGIIDRLISGVSSKGVSVLQLQAEFDIDARKLLPILRYIASQGWIQEVDEDSFLPTRLTIELTEGKAGRKWIMTPGKPKIASSLSALLLHPDREWRYSMAAHQTAFQLSHNTELTLFDYMKQHPDELAQWARSVQSLGDAYEFSLMNDYSWSKLAPDVFIDCGGGTGNLSIALSKILPNKKFIVQDLEECAPIAKQNISTKYSGGLKSGSISIEVHNLFQTQPIRNYPAVYMLRYILHDWPDEACVKILGNIVKSAKKGSKVVIMEVICVPGMITPSTMSSEEGVGLDDLLYAREYHPISPPPYIPQNFGAYSKVPLALGVHMMGVFNARERTLREWANIISQTGLKISGVSTLRGNVSVITCDVGDDSGRTNDWLSPRPGKNNTKLM